MIKRLTFFTVVLIGLGVSQLFGQDSEIVGVVKDQQTGETLPGATLTIKGTNTGTITDVDGRFSLKAEPDATLIFSFVGYTDVEVFLGGRTSLEVEMYLDIQALEEIVVVGYTTQKKKDLAGSVSVVDMDEIGKITYANPLQALQGRVAGLNFTQTGEPGSVGTSVNVRGFTTFNNYGPLYVIDGIPSFEPPNNLNGNDIQSIQVLKDASASIYGSRAANGVIIISTKQGRDGKLSVDGGVTLGLQTRANYLDLLSADEWGDVYWEAAKNDNPNRVPSFTGYFDLNGKSESLIDPQFYDLAQKDQTYLYTKKGTNWADEIYRNGSTKNYYVNVSNGNSKGNVMFGASYFDEQGTIITSYFKRYTVRLNSNYNLTPWFKVGENLSISNSERVGVGGAANDVVRQHPALPVYDVNGKFAGRVGDFPDIRNTVSQLTRNKNNTSDSWRIFGNVNAEADLLKAISVLPKSHSFFVRTNLGLDYSNYYDQAFNSSVFEGVYQIPQNSYFNKFGDGITTTWNGFAEYDFVSGDHDLKVMAGIETVEYNYRDLEASRAGYAIETPDYVTVGSGETIAGANGSRSDWGLYSEIARLDYVFKQRYMFTLLYRHDYSSRFTPDGDFPTVMAAWRFSDEPFFKSAFGDRVINSAKLRASYGMLGNQNTGTLYNQFTFFGPNDLNANYDLSGTNNSIQQGFVVLTRGNPFLRWESTRHSNIGLDLKLFGNTLEVSLDAYHKITTDLISNPPLALAVGEGTPPFVNSAKLTNNGIDVVVTHFYNPVRDFSLSTSFQFTHYNSVVTDLDNRYPVGYENERYFDNGGRIAEGREMREFYGWVNEGIFQNTEQVEAHAAQTGKDVGRLMWKDVNGDSVINDQDRTYIGNPNPDFTAGLNFSAKYKKVYLDMFFYASVGHDVYNGLRVTNELAQIGTYNRTTAILDAWSPTNTNGTVPALTLDDRGNDESRASSYFVEDASFLKMRTLRVGYQLSPSFFSGFTCNIYGEVQNLFTLTGYSGIDPEVPGGYDGGVYPLPRTFILGVNLKL